MRREQASTHSQLRRRPGRLDWTGLASALTNAGTPAYLTALVDLIGSLLAHDRITVTRYVANARPEFVTHRNFSDALVTRYLEVYYPFDPFHAFWSRTEATGVVPLSRFSSRELKQGRYIAEFLAQSVIRDEVGVLLDDGPHATLGVFLERSAKSFSHRDIARLEDVFPALAALHGLHRRILQPAPRAKIVSRSSRPSNQRPTDLDGLWQTLTRREHEVVALVLAGHSSPAIAAKLGISPGTVRNHRMSIYTKLDITSEREVFLAYLDAIVR